jgi:hypothetical protein
VHGQIRRHQFATHGESTPGEIRGFTVLPKSRSKKLIKPTTSPSSDKTTPPSTQKSAVFANYSSLVVLDMMQIDANEADMMIVSMHLGTVMSGSNSANAISEDLMLNLVPVITFRFQPCICKNCDPMQRGLQCMSEISLKNPPTRFVRKSKNSSAPRNQE